MQRACGPRLGRARGPSARCSLGCRISNPCPPRRSEHWGVVAPRGPWPRVTVCSPRASPVTGSSSSLRARSTCGKRRRRAASRASTPRGRPPPWGKCRSSMGVAISPRRSRRRRRSSSFSRAPPSSRCVSGGRPWRSHSSKRWPSGCGASPRSPRISRSREVTERVARHLEAAAKAAGRPLAAGTTFELALTQEQLATRLGTVRELVARTLAQLRRSGVIAQRGRRVTILDPAQLATCARGRRDGGRQGRPPLPWLGTVT
jgi:hypothetical protein